MTKRKTHDTVTLTNVSRNDSDPFLLLKRGIQKPKIEPVSSSKITERICSFIPKIAAANKSLTEDSGNDLDVDVQKVANELDESDTSTSGTTSDEIDSDDEGDPRVQFDLTLFRAKQLQGSEDLEIPQDVEALPEGFQEDSESGCDDNIVHNARKLVEEL